MNKAFELKYIVILVNREEGGLIYFPVHMAFVLKYIVIFVNRQEGGGGCWFTF